MIDIGIILKTLRTESRLTQAQLAEHMAVSVSTVASWENAFKFPTADKVVKLAALYRVPLNYIVGIDRERAVVLDGLSTKQQNILKTLVLEFQKKQSASRGLTDRQKEILSDLLAELI